MRAAGRCGQLRYRYQVAIRLGSWTLKPVIGTSGHRFHLSAVVVERIEPWTSYRPLDLYLTFGASEWIWHTVHLDPVGSVTDLELQGTPTIMQRSN
jgi:hypothetical protein